MYKQSSVNKSAKTTARYAMAEPAKKLQAVEALERAYERAQQNVDKQTADRRATKVTASEGTASRAAVNE